MTSLTYARTGTAGESIQVFGAAKGRTAWTIYNPSATAIYWSNSRSSGTTDGFIIPAGGSWGLEIPQDDPTLEVWIYDGTGVQFYVYEGFG
jgi:hypothetical protein